MARALAGRVCVVTGASRGIGKGIALQLGEAGATVYITGRNMESLQQAAKEVESRGGRCIAVVCDSGMEEQVGALFERLRREQDGALDILVNNAFSGVKTIFENRDKRFWEMAASTWDDINGVGLRGHYLCSVYAARMMVTAGKGLIVVVSSMGGLRYTFNVPYGVGKAACDRLAADCAHELRREGVAYVSLWPGPVRTETVNTMILNSPATNKAEQAMIDIFACGESPELSGRCVVALATDKDILKKSGRVHLTCDIATEYGLRDVDGQAVVQYRSLSFLLKQVPGLAWLGSLLPQFLKVPKWVLALVASHF